MAIYVDISKQELEAVVRQYGLGELVEARAIPQGSINTNWALTTATGRWFLRHTRVRGEAALRYEAGLLDHLEQAGYPALRLKATRSGARWLPLHGGWVSVFSWVAGEERGACLDVASMERLGMELGKLHRLTSSFEGRRENPYGLPVVRGWLTELAAHRDVSLAEAAARLSRVLDDCEAHLGGVMVPRGTLHADLFPDNVRWLGSYVAGILDFEMACTAPLTLDVAITLCAFCFDEPRGRFDEAACRALVRGYGSERPLTEPEVPALWHQLRFAAVRYTASRIRDFHLSGAGADRLAFKDWRAFQARLDALEAMGEAGLSGALGLGLD